MNALLVVGLIGVLVLLLIVVAGGGKSLNALMLRREVGEAVRKAQPGASITDVEVAGPGELGVVVQDVSEQHRLQVVSQDKYTAAIAHDPTLPMPRSGTYSFEPQTSFVCSNGADEDQLVAVRARIEAALNAALPTRGFHQIMAGSPDILVAYHAATDGPLSAAEFQESYGYGEAGWITSRESTGETSGGTIAPIYEKGSLIVDFLEPASRRLGWRAAVVADIVLDVPEEARIERIRDAVELALRFYPPEPGVGDGTASATKRG